MEIKNDIMKKIVLNIFFFFLVLNISAQEEISYEKALQKVKETGFILDDKSVELNKEAIQASAPMINFFMKYKDGAGKANQGDFDKMLQQMGIMEEIQNDKSGLTKEDAFKFVDAYIQADMGEQGAQFDIDQNTKNKITEFLTQLENGEQNAQSVFDQVITEEKVNDFVRQAQAEIEKLQTSGFGISYDDFKREAKKKKPNVTDAEIQKAYKDLMKQLGL